MVRYKKRYFVIQLDRHSDVAEQLLPKDGQDSTALQPPNKKKKLSKPSKVRKRSLCDPKPLSFHDGHLSNAVKDVVSQIHGDFGRASITIGLRTIYCNPETRLCLIQCRHGPHRLLASSLPFLNKVGDEDKLIPRLIYCGATIRNCYKRMEQHQRRELEAAIREFGDADELDLKLFQEKLSELRGSDQ